MSILLKKPSTLCRIRQLPPAAQSAEGVDNVCLFKRQIIKRTTNVVCQSLRFGGHATSRIVIQVTVIQGLS